jgi:hypothetical protein
MIESLSVWRDGSLCINMALLPADGWGARVFAVLGVRTESRQKAEEPGAAENQLFMCGGADAPCGPANNEAPSAHLWVRSTKSRSQTSHTCFANRKREVIDGRKCMPSALTSQGGVEIRLHLRFKATKSGPEDQAGARRWTSDRLWLWVAGRMNVLAFLTRSR